MHEHLLVGLASIIILGIGAQWIAWRLHLPSILLLLFFGILAGPVTGFLDPDALLGSILFPTVSVSVAIILFEGGLSLRISELGGIGTIVRNLVTIGALVTMATGSLCAFFLLHLDLQLSLLLGSILIVSGPTVIIPLLRIVRPTAQVSSILRWEGIVIDPIGALVAVLVFEGIISAGLREATSLAVIGIIKALLIGGTLGIAGAALLIFLLKHYWIPDFLQETASLMLVIAAFTASNALQAESGLLATTLMGIVLANQKFIPVRHIVEFKENLRVLLISILFILLSSRLRSSDMEVINVSSMVFLGIMIFITRPLAVMLSTRGSKLSWAERHFLSGMAPRGIVAAAVSSIFTLRLMEIHHPQAEQLVPLTFFMIVGTVTIYGLTTLPLARLLKVAQKSPQGTLILGAHRAAREIGRILQQEGYQVLLVDTDWFDVRTARMEGLHAHHGSFLSERWFERIEFEGMLNGIGKLLALTSNHEANALAAVHFREYFGRQEVYQLPPEPEETPDREGGFPQDLRGRFLFSEAATYLNLRNKFEAGSVIKKNTITEEYGYSELTSYHGGTMLPLFVIEQDRRLTVVTAGSQIRLEPGQILISVVDPKT